jgi:hypothetical protein
MNAPTRIKTSYMARRDGAEPGPDDPLLGFTPVPHKQLKKNSLNPDRQRKFIAALAATGIVTDAAKAAGASQEAFYRLRNQPGAEEFRAAWDEALDRALTRIEDAAVQRAIEGVEKPIVSGGKLLGWYRVHNEGLVMFLLRNRKPHRYGAEPAPKPGDPVYEKIKAEVLEEYEGDEQEVFDSIDKFIDDMRVRRLANDEILVETASDEEEGPDGEDPARPGPSVRTL